MPPEPLTSRSVGRWPLSRTSVALLVFLLLPPLLLAGLLIALDPGDAEHRRQARQALAGEAALLSSTLSAAAAGQSFAASGFNVQQVRDLVRRLALGEDLRILVFAPDGVLLADTTRRLADSAGGGSVVISPLPPPDNGGEQEKMAAAPRTLVDWLQHLSSGLRPAAVPVPALPVPTELNARHMPEAETALAGTPGTALWRGPEGQVLVAAAAPVRRGTRVIGAVTLLRPLEPRPGPEIGEPLGAGLLASLALAAVLWLICLWRLIRPLRRLTVAASWLGTARQRHLALPPYDRRPGEIGALSRTLGETARRLNQKQEAAELFAADVTHEIKSPLTSLKSAVETIHRLDDPVQQKRLLDIVVEDVSRLDRLITDISDATRLDRELGQAETTPVDLVELLSAVVEIEGASDEGGDDAARRVPLRLAAVPQNRIVVDGLADRLVQILRNLIGNARSFSPAQGEVRITLQSGPGRVTILVDDDGPGIPPGKLETIFDRFYSDRGELDAEAKRSGGHSGLGLAISRQIAEAHGGTLTAENRQEGGARFRLTLPLAS